MEGMRGRRCFGLCDREIALIMAQVLPFVCSKDRVFLFLNLRTKFFGMGPQGFVLGDFCLNALFVRDQ
jgi:hypothetical protein